MSTTEPAAPPQAAPRGAQTPAAAPPGPKVMAPGAILERARELAPKGFLTGAERASLAHEGTPLYIRGADIRDTTYGPQVWFFLTIGAPEAKSQDDVRTLTLSHNDQRQAFYDAIRPFLNQRGSVVGPFYLVQLPPTRPGMSGAWVLSEAPYGGPDAADIPF